MSDQPLLRRFSRWFRKADESDVKRDNVPKALVPFLDVVHKWGALSSDSERYALADRAEADPRELKELEDFMRAFTPEIEKVYSKWEAGRNMRENKTLARFYFTFLLVDELQIKLPPDESEDHVGDLIGRLNRGSAWHAQLLADYGDDAKRAVPNLQAALKGGSAKLRIWSHYALATSTCIAQQSSGCENRTRMRSRRPIALWNA